jgi:hypothetical protein
MAKSDDIIFRVSKKTLLVSILLIVFIIFGVIGISIKQTDLLSTFNSRDTEVETLIEKEGDLENNQPATSSEPKFETSITAEGTGNTAPFKLKSGNYKVQYNYQVQEKEFCKDFSWSNEAGLYSTDGSIERDKFIVLASNGDGTGIGESYVYNLEEKEYYINAPYYGCKFVITFYQI